MEHEGRTEFSYSDALVLYCIQSHRRGAAISDILGCQDMVERAFSSCEELDLSLRRFMAMGLIIREHGRFVPTGPLLHWQMHGDRKAIDISAITRQYQAQLNALAAKVMLHSMPLPEQVLDATGYAQALQRYHRSFALGMVRLLIIASSVVIAGVLLLKALL